MELTQSALPIGAFILGVLVGLAVALKVLGRGDRQRKAEVAALANDLKASFGDLSLQALSQATQQLAAQAGQRLESERALHSQELDGKKRLIDQQLHTMSATLGNVSHLIAELKTQNAEKTSEVAGRLQEMSRQAGALAETTQALREALADTRIRGQWGERMAEDVLRMAGFVENINYRKQSTIEGIGTRPDFTFLLPRDLVLNMDVKFPLTNYLAYLGAEGEADKTRCRGDFLKDVRARIREITTRHYINPESRTVDCVLLFIPNEHVYAFINEQDNAILDEALRNKVVLCSPITLFAILAIVRQAVDSFHLAETTNEILDLLSVFKKQWGMFTDRMGVLGRRIQDTQREYDVLMSTRRQQLEKHLNRIDDLRQEHGLAQADDGEPALIPAGEGEME